MPTAIMQATEPVQQRMDLQLHPKYLSQPKEGLQRMVKDQLMKYSSKLGGVPVKANRIVLETRSGIIFEDQAAVHIAAIVDFLVFRPQPTQFLLGTVKKVTPSHVGVLVNDHFSASIAYAQLPDGFAYNDERQAFTFQGSDSNCIEVDARVRFQVTVLETSTHGVISIVGSMLAPETGYVSRQTAFAFQARVSFYHLVSPSSPSSLSP
jgi:DNA-directed RNA polymerase subunit E'/Rpb7